MTARHILDLAREQVLEGGEGLGRLARVPGRGLGGGLRRRREPLVVHRRRDVVLGLRGGGRELGWLGDRPGCLRCRAGRLESWLDRFRGGEDRALGGVVCGRAVTKPCGAHVV